MEFTTLVGHVTTVAGSLFGVAGQALDFVMENTILLYGLIASIISMGVGLCIRIFKSF